MKFHTCRTFLVSTLSVLMLGSNAVAQDRASAIGLERTIFLSQLQVAIDSLLNRQQHAAAIAAKNFLGEGKKFAENIASVGEGILTRAKDSLSVARMDSAKILRVQLATAAQNAAEEHALTFNRELDQFRGEIDLLAQKFRPCDYCATAEDFDEAIEDFRQSADSLRELSDERLAAILDSGKDLVSDTAAVLLETLDDGVRTLVEQQLDERELEQLRASRFEVISDGHSRVVYRGRDNGVQNAGAIGAVAYRHRSGFSGSLATSYVNRSANQWDNVSLGLGYQHNFASGFGVAMQYSHYWFNDSSVSQQSVFNNSFGLSTTIPARVVSVVPTVVMDVGDQIEYTLLLSLYRDIDLLPNSRTVQATLEPTLTLIYGQQKTELIQQKMTIVRRKITTQTTSSTYQTFGIMDYEFAFPVMIQWNHLTVIPTLNYIVPVNVIDVSTPTPYVDAQLTVTWSIRP